jgi:hypothetical protein
MISWHKFSSGHCEYNSNFTSPKEDSLCSSVYLHPKKYRKANLFAAVGACSYHFIHVGYQSLNTNLKIFKKHFTLLLFKKPYKPVFNQQVNWWLLICYLITQAYA